MKFEYTAPYITHKMVALSKSLLCFITEFVEWGEIFSFLRYGLWAEVENTATLLENYLAKNKKTIKHTSTTFWKWKMKYFHFIGKI